MTSPAPTIESHTSHVTSESLRPGDLVCNGSLEWLRLIISVQQMYDYDTNGRCFKYLIVSSGLGSNNISALFYVEDCGWNRIKCLPSR